MNERSIKSQLKILSGGSMAVFLGLSLIIVIAVVTGTNNTMKIQSEEALHKQIRSNAIDTIESTAELFRETMVSNLEGFVNVIGEAMSDTYRSDYNMEIGVLTSCFEYGDVYLAQCAALTQDSRQTKPVSLSKSSYYVPSSTPADIPNFSAALNLTRDRAQNVDPFFAKLYEMYDPFVATYIGFEESGLFVHYPGIGTLDTDPNREYNPRVRGWYTAAQTAGRAVYTAPYQDFNGKGWMITIAVPLYVDSVLIGVVGGDMLIESIKDTMNSIQFLDSGKVTLFEDDGTVVTDKEWEADASDSSGYTYSDLESPPISSDLWDQITETDAGKTTSIDSEGDDSVDYLFIVHHLDSYGLGLDKYYLLVSVPESEITEPIDEIIGEMVKVNLSIGLGFSFSVIAFSVLAGLLIIYIGNQTTKPITKARKNIDRITKRIGHESQDMYEMKVDDDEEEFAEEFQEMNNGYENMMGQLQANREQAQAQMHVENQFHGGHALLMAPTQMPNYDQYAQPQSAPPALGVASAPQMSGSDSDDDRGVLPPYMQQTDHAAAFPPSYSVATGYSNSRTNSDSNADSDYSSSE